MIDSQYVIYNACFTIRKIDMKYLYMKQNEMLTFTNVYGNRPSQSLIRQYDL